MHLLALDFLFPPAKTSIPESIKNMNFEGENYLFACGFRYATSDALKINAPEINAPDIS